MNRREILKVLRKQMHQRRQAEREVRESAQVDAIFSYLNYVELVRDLEEGKIKNLNGRRMG